MSKKLVLTVLATAAVAGSFGATVALNNANSSAKTAEDSQLIAAATDKTTELGASLVDETVYVFAKTDGSVRKTVSSDWTKNSLGLDEYTKTEKSVDTPIKLKITYTLDGEEISAKDLKGKSGKVAISYDYENTAKSGNLFVPYAVMSGLILDNNVFTDVEVDGGKLINDGDKSIVAGIAFPGLRENLGISKSDLDIPSSLKITADAKDFKLGMAMSIATSEIFDELDTSSFDSLDNLTGQLSKLESGMDQLISGSSALYNGLSELNEKSGALISGVNQLSAGATELKTGLKTISDGTNTLNSGLAQLASNNDALNSGASQLKTGVFQLVNAQLGAQLGGTPLAGYLPVNESDYADKLDQIAAASGADMTSLKNLLAGVIGLNTNLATYTGTVAVISQKTSALAEGTNSAYAGATKLESGLTTLNSSTPSLKDGITKLQQGAGDLNSGLNTFNEQGVSKLISAAGSLENLAKNLKATVNLAKTQKPVKYIYRVDEIK